jgi:hypothetical protein
MLPSAARASRGFELEILGGGDEFQTLADQTRRQPFEAELQAPRQDRHRQLLRIGGGQQELDVRRRFLERFQQRVERVIRQHVHLVDEVHLVASAARCVLHVVEQFTRVIDLGARGRIHFDEIDETTLVDLPACGAHAAGIRAHAGFAVQRFGEYARHRGFADSAGAGKQEGVMDFAAVERVAQGAQHMLLPHHFGEALGAPLAR